MQPTASREIVGFLTVFVARLRRLMGNPLGGSLPSQRPML
jgi:hypothetical protein